MWIDIRQQQPPHNIWINFLLLKNPFYFSNCPCITTGKFIIDHIGPVLRAYDLFNVITQEKHNATFEIRPKLNIPKMIYWRLFVNITSCNIGKKYEKEFIFKSINRFTILDLD